MTVLKKLTSVFGAIAVSITLITVLIGLGTNWGAVSSRLTAIEARASTCETNMGKKLSLEDYNSDMAEFRTDVREIKQDIKTILQRTAHYK